VTKQTDPTPTPVRRSNRNSTFDVPETPTSRAIPRVLQTPLASKSSSVAQTPAQTPGYLDLRLLMTPSGMLPRVTVIPNTASKGKLLFVCLFVCFCFFFSFFRMFLATS